MAPSVHENKQAYHYSNLYTNLYFEVHTCTPTNFINRANTHLVFKYGKYTTPRDKIKDLKSIYGAKYLEHQKRLIAPIRRTLIYQITIARVIS